MSDNPALLHLPGHDAGRGAPRRVLEWLEDNARQFGQRPAVEAIGRPALSHAGLYQQVQQTSDALLENNIGRGDVVLIMLPNGPEALTALLSTTAVAVALPLGTNEPIQAIADAVSQTTARAIIYDQAHPALAPQLIEKFGLVPLPVTVDRTLPAGTLNFQQLRPVQRATATHIDDAATLGRTAGTTSKPRVVAWSQASLYRSADVVGKWMGLTEHDRSLCVMPFITLHTLVRSCVPGLIRGGTVICTPGFDKVRVLDWIRDYRPTYMTAVPGIYKDILLRAGPTPLRTSLRFLASGSDRMDSETVHKLARTFDVPVREFYGMNEVSPMLAATPEGVLAQADGITGRPMDDWALEARNDSGTTLPRGQQGEIVARGGYFNPTLDGSARVEDNWYFTGDVGFIDDDGCLHVTGRMDDRITRGGKKIAPDAVERAMQDHPDVARAVAFPIPDEILGQRLGALVIPTAGSTPAELALRSYLADTLLDYMVPECIVFRDAVPLTEIGKVSRKRLAQQLDIQAIERPNQVTHLVKAELSQTEATLLEIVRELLQQPEINATDDFMQCGGDSFAATVLLVEIEEQFGALLTPGQFLGNSSVVGLAALIDADTTDHLPVELETIQAGDDSNPSLFFAHGPEGYALYSHFIVPHLPANQTVYAFRYCEKNPASEMEAYAAHYAGIMQSLQADGPFYIAGHSFGAQLAYETAQQLVTAGREVAFLALLDDEADLFKRKFGVLKLPEPAPSTFNLFKRMLDRYTASLYPGDIDLFIAESPPLERLAEPSMGWTDLTVGKISYCEVPGDHSTMMARKNIDQWAPRFAQRLADARSDWPCRQEQWGQRLSAVNARLALPDVAATLYARRASRAGDIKAEISAYLSAVQHNPDQPYWVYRNLAEAHEQSGKLEQAYQYYHESIAREKSSIPGSIRLAHFLNDTDRCNDSMALLRAVEPGVESLSLNEQVLALVRLSQTWCDFGDAKEAERCARRALELDVGDIDAVMALVQALIQQRHLDEALALTTTVTRLRPNRQQAFFRLGIIHKLREDLPAAEQAMVRATELAPRFILAYRQLSEVYELLGRPEDALQAARKASELDPNNAKHAAYYGDVAQRSGYPDIAEQALLNAARINPELLWPYRSLRHLYRKQGRKKQALAAQIQTSRLEIRASFSEGLAKGLRKSVASGYHTLKLLLD